MADLCTLAQAKAALDIPTDSTVDDAEISQWISAVTPIIEGIVGPVAARSVTESHDGGQQTIVLRQLPATEVASVTEYVGFIRYDLLVVTTPDQATAYSASFDQQAGTLTRRYGIGSSLFAEGVDNVWVTYTAGYADIPPNVVAAAIELVRHNYEATQVAGSTFGSGDTDGSYPALGSGFAVPNRVIELLQPNQRLPGLA